MGRLPTFVAGVLLGAALCFVSLKYHVVRAEDGFHLIPKMSAEFGEAYVDIRSFGLADWDEHTSLAVAITQAGQADLLNNSASTTLRNAVDSVLHTLNGGSTYGR